jgi:transcriptional regulator with XRE-family HTH domain
VSINHIVCDVDIVAVIVYYNQMQATQLYRGIGALIRDHRKRIKLTQEKLSQQVGISRASLANIEGGRQQVLVHQLCNLASALGVNPQALIPEATRHSLAGLADTTPLPPDLTRAQKQQLLKLLRSADSDE